jgi:hypothetical protein
MQIDLYRLLITNKTYGDIAKVYIIKDELYIKLIDRYYMVGRSLNYLHGHRLSGTLTKKLFADHVMKDYKSCVNSWRRN